MHALTPQLDARAVAALLDLRARGFDLSVVEISPLPFADVGRRPEEHLTFRIWRMRREALRARFERVGVPVGTWDEDGQLVGALEEVRAFRRYARSGRA